LVGLGIVTIASRQRNPFTHEFRMLPGFMAAFLPHQHKACPAKISAQLPQLSRHSPDLTLAQRALVDPKWVIGS
jgi:hypothetical protein